MNKDTMKQYALPMIAIGVILMIAGGYQAFNPVLAVSAHDDRADTRSMLATTTFTVEGFDPTVHLHGAPSGSVQEGTPVTLTCTWDFDGLTPGWVSFNHNYPWKALHQNAVTTQTGSQSQDVFVPSVNNDMISAVFGCTIQDGAGKEVATQWSPPYTILDVPNPPAQIDDTTDTLTLTASSYSLGDTVGMQAWGENIGGETWLGSVYFIITQPDGKLFDEVAQYDLSVTAGSSEIVTDSFSLPSTGQSGTWTIQSKWIDEDGNVHALSTIDLGTETIWGFDIDVFGALIAMIGLLIVGYGLSKRKS